MPLFSGITGIEAGALQADGSQLIRFSADLPFQYQTQVLDANNVVLRIYNARLGQALLTQEGAINVLAGGAIESARLRSAAPTAAGTASNFQELVFSGAGLGRLKLKIMGGEALPVKVTLPQTKSQSVPERLAAARTRPSVNATGRVAPVGQPVAKGKPFNPGVGRSLSHLDALKKELKTSKSAVDGSGFDKMMGQPLAMMAVAPEIPAPVESRGPQIASVTSLAGGMPQATAGPVARLAEKSVPPVAPEPVEAGAPLSSEEAYPEPAYQALTPLPRYQGGAAPIQAMTTDANGKPILIRPKNQPIPEFSINQSPESFNVLFQAEGTPAQQRVANLMAESLKVYHARQYAKALPLIQQALQLQSDNADLYAALAEIQGQLAQKQEAAKAYARAYHYNPQQYGQPYAQALVLVGQRGKAIEVLTALYGKNPNQAGVAYMLGTLYEELGQTEQALPFLKQAAELHPGSADIQYNLGLAYELSGDNLLAERHYQRALRLDASAADAQKALTRVRAASRE
ncbi:tetratricopeptide repeat protein [Vampirovibrio chlorellavorus]|uniref:tetratricopeptide repeat protein n=1 Tax=Vampirovibrio chlorellavorus TaxID=758823 RepID=UPI0026ED2159|nr:tetratricopeptide repeat protein [Vampirovibrio chlorellavorus]